MKKFLFVAVAVILALNVSTNAMALFGKKKTEA